MEIIWKEKWDMAVSYKDVYAVKYKADEHQVSVELHSNTVKIDDKIFSSGNAVVGRVAYNFAGSNQPFLNPEGKNLEFFKKLGLITLKASPVSEVAASTKK